MINCKKEFMQQIRKVSYEDHYLILVGDVMPQLIRYVTQIHETEFADGSYEIYYEDLTKYISSFLIYWNSMIDDIIQEADKCTNSNNKEELLILMKHTIDIHQTRQVTFKEGFLPVQSPFEEQTYEQMEELFNLHTQKLEDLKETIEGLDKQEKIYSFVEDHFKLTIKGTAKLFEATHVFISIMLTKRINNIQVSLEEIILRVRKSLREIQVQSREKLDALLHQLHDKTRALQASCQYGESSTDYAETEHAIEKIRAKIAKHSIDPVLSRVQEEEAYWQRRIDDFRETSTGLLQLMKEQDNVLQQEEVYKSLKTTELPGSKKQCWLNIGENFAERKKHLKKKIIEAGRMLVTFFAVRGADHIFYADDVGRYFLDEFNNRVYVFDYGLKTSPCSSQYNTASTLLRTTTQGSEQLELKQTDNRRNGKASPNRSIDRFEIKGNLSPSVVQYLWSGLGAERPRALLAAAPLRHLAHILLMLKYNQNKNEFDKNMKDAAEYRANIFKERKEKAAAASRAWKRQQPRRRAPGDDSDVLLAHAEGLAGLTRHHNQE